MKKFRDPKTGEVFENIWELFYSYCGYWKICDNCRLSITKNQERMFCFELVSRFPEKAARLMGYEVIDDTPTDTPTVSGDIPTDEDINVPGKPLSEWTLKKAPHLTEAEITIMWDMGAKWVSRDDLVDSDAVLWDDKPNKVIGNSYYYPPNGKKRIARIRCDIFPSVNPGDLIEAGEENDNI